MSKAKPIPDGMHTITPHIVCAGAAQAIAFYGKAFGAVEEMRLEGMPGKIMHACVKIGDSRLFLVDEMPDWGCMGPSPDKASPVTIHLSVADADAAFQRAVDAGCTVKMPLADMFWGDRYGVLTDPFGHSWSIATHLKDLTPEEIKQAAAAMMANCN